MALPNLGKMKDLYKMKKKADKMKKRMEKIKTTVEHKGIEVDIRGDQQVEDIRIDGESQGKLVTAINKAIKDSQKEVAKKMRGQLGDFGF